MRIIIAVSTALLCGCNAQTTSQLATMIGQVANQSSSDRYQQPAYTPQPDYTPPEFTSGPTAYTEAEPINAPTATISNQLCYGVSSFDPQTPTAPGAMAGGC